MNRLILSAIGAASLGFGASAAQAITVFDPAGDFLASYVGTHAKDLDVTSFSVSYNPVLSQFLLGATFAGPINPAQPGLYVIGANTGSGVNAPFGPIGQPNVRFNQVILINKDGTGSVSGAAGGALNPANITIVGNLFTARIPLAMLPTTGFGPGQYGFNIWPRDGLPGATHISDFAPENAVLAANPVPEPASWAMMITGLGLAAGALRRRGGEPVRIRVG